MEDTLSLMLALEKIKRPEDQGYLVYTYVLNPEGNKPVAYFIPLYITSSCERASEKAREIIETTGYKDILTYPMGLWISLGDSTVEKVTPVEVHDGIKDYAEREEKKKEERSKERKRIEEEVKAEQRNIQDPESIESYYYDWFCAVQNKNYLTSLKKEISNLEEAYKKRLDNIKAKNLKHPEFRDTWQKVLLERLSRRGEKLQAEFVIREANEIVKDEGI